MSEIYHDILEYVLEDMMNLTLSLGELFFYTKDELKRDVIIEAYRRRLSEEEVDKAVAYALKNYNLEIWSYIYASVFLRDKDIFLLGVKVKDIAKKEFDALTRMSGGKKGGRTFADLLKTFGIDDIKEAERIFIDNFALSCSENNINKISDDILETILTEKDLHSYTEDELTAKAQHLAKTLGLSERDIERVVSCVKFQFDIKQMREEIIKSAKLDALLSTQNEFKPCPDLDCLVNNTEVIYKEDFRLELKVDDNVLDNWVKSLHKSGFKDIKSCTINNYINQAFRSNLPLWI